MSGFLARAGHAIGRVIASFGWGLGLYSDADREVYSTSVVQDTTWQTYSPNLVLIAGPHPDEMVLSRLNQEASLEVRDIQQSVGFKRSERLMHNVSLKVLGNLRISTLVDEPRSVVEMESDAVGHPRGTVTAQFEAASPEITVRKS